MLVSLKNIARYVSLDGLSAEEIANGLTFAGVEVEDIKYLARGTNLVIGKILECAGSLPPGTIMFEDTDVTDTN